PWPSGACVPVHPVTGSSLIASGSARQVPAKHWVVQTALFGTYEHACVNGSQMSAVHEKPSLQMLSLMQPEPQSQKSVVQGLLSLQFTGVTWQTPRTHCSFCVQKLVSAQSALVMQAGGVYVTVRRGRWAAPAVSSRLT